MKSKNEAHLSALKETGESIYAYMGKVLKRADEDAIEIERLKACNDAARQAYNNGSLVMRACKYDYDKARLLQYEIPRLQIERERLALAKSKSIQAEL